MNETMLVRAAGGGWEELRPQTELPTGGVIELFGEDVGPVLGTSSPLIVASCAPVLTTGAPDAICVDPDGGIWIMQLALDGASEMTLPKLLAFGGGLAGQSYDSFEELCNQTGSDTLAGYVEARSAGAGFHRQSFEVAVADALAHGRFRLVAVVSEAAPTLVQSMRFLNASGARGMVFEADSFASATVSAVRARQIDVGLVDSQQQAGEPLAARANGSDLGAAGFVAATGKLSGDVTSSLMAQLQKACIAVYDEVSYETVDGQAQMHAMLATPDGIKPMVIAASDGTVALSFDALGSIDRGWSIRTELCQGMERLLGADLGDVRKISQLNTSIGEHLMDATLMEALGELLADTVEALRDAANAAGAREVAAA